MGNDAAGRITSCRWEHGKVVDEGFPLEDVSELLERENSLIWVDLCEPDHAGLRALSAELGLDPHAVEDAVSAGERPKATRHAKHTFITVYATRLEPGGEPPRAPTTPSPWGRSRACARHGSRRSCSPGASSRSAAATTSTWSRCSTGGTTTPSCSISASERSCTGCSTPSSTGTSRRSSSSTTRSRASKTCSSTSSGRPHAVQVRTYRLRKELVELRRVVLPMRDVVNAVLRHRRDLDQRHTELDGFYDDLYDHVLRAAEWTESLRDMVTTIFETNLSLQDARLNTVMKKLTGWAAIIAVPTAVTGWFGQNVPYPGFGRPWGVLFSAAVIAGVAVTLYGVFRRKGWI